jgi:ribonuclease R
MVCDLALDDSGKPLQADIYEAVMRSHARLTYTRVADALAGEPDPQVRPVLEDLKVAQALAQKLNQQRRARGSIDFDLPEAKIVLDDQGRILEIVKRPRNDAHRLIEEFMLAANEGVARFFEVRGLPTVYRIHDQPDRDKLEAFAVLARSHGFELPSGEDLTPAVLNEFLKRVEGKPAQKALNALLLRAMMQAQYSPENIGHYGLAAPTYLHFTSPIRRYPDLMVHRLLKEHWARGGRPLKENEREEQEAYLAGVAAQCSERERAAMKAERDVEAFYSALYMQDKIGEKYKAVISGVAEFGLFCELEEVFVEGLIPAETLGENVKLEKERQRLVVGSTGKSYSIGDEVTVEVVSADPARRRISLALAGEGARKAGPWLTPEDLPATSPSKPRRQGPRAPQPTPRRPPRGSPPGRKTRRRETRGGGR